MQFMLLVYENREPFAKIPDAVKRRCSDACDDWNEKLKQSGHARAMSRLQVISSATTVRKADHRFLITDGPFAETKEVFAGFVIIECRDRAEALEITKTFPGVEIGLAVEVRPIMTDEEEKRRWRQP